MQGIKLIHGSGNMLSMIDELRERVLSGEIEGVAFAFASDKGLYYGHAWKESAPKIWARLHTAVSLEQHDLLVNGLGEA